MKTLFGGSVPVHIFFWGIWEPGISQLMEHTLKLGDTFIDVGANIGYHSLLASKLIGQAGIVMALEPAPQIRAQLLENVGLNPDIRGWANIRIVPYCALETETDVMFHVVSEGNTGLSSIRTVPESTPILVKARRLDDILSGQDLSRCPLLKMDIEGSEYRALLGMDQILERYTELSLIIEIAPAYLKEAGSSADELFNHLQTKGYSAFLVDSPKANPYKRPLILRPIGRIGLDIVPNEQQAEFNVLFTKVPHEFRRFIV